jgi:twitching motility protein PilT
MAGTYGGVRCRVHIFRQQGVPSIALRLLQDHIPDLESLGLPAAALKLPDLHKGIVLVTGETSSGKSTTLAAMLDYINHNMRCHIVTLEDPVEYVYKPDRAAINQREIGKDTRSFSDGLRATLREDPNVILIGEMRDRDTIETAITAAETGHLVFATLHTGSASDAVDRIVQVFPEGMQIQIRLQLSMVLQAVLTQQLIGRKGGGGRVLACEMMVVTDAIRNLIRAGNTPQIANTIATTAAIGGQTMDMALVRLVRNGSITREAALHYARDIDYVKKNAV